LKPRIHAVTKEGGAPDMRDEDRPDAIIDAHQAALATQRETASTPGALCLPSEPQPVMLEEQPISQA
jgi:hypothetical protein